MKQSPKPPLDRESLHDDPVDQFREWFRDVREEGVLSLPDAACLSTVGEDGYPQGRMVLVKGCDDDGFVFYTNLGSRKARALEATPRAALTLYWEPVRRQVRVEGDVERVSDEEADAYFAQRPRGSQIGAWASEQSEVAADREELERSYREAEARFAEVDAVPRPSFWSGFRVRHRSVEFWQEGADRMHDRFRYERARDGWEIIRLFP